MTLGLHGERKFLHLQPPPPPPPPWCLPHEIILHRKFKDILLCFLNCPFLENPFLKELLQATEALRWLQEC